MKIIYVGGYADKNKSHFINYKSYVQSLIDSNKKVIIIALAQEPAYFAERLKELYPNTPEILDSNTQSEIVWSSYNLIYIIGGNTQKLKTGLLNFGFDIEKLKKEVVLLGDSAGANVLAKNYVGKSSEGYKVEEGLNPQSNIFVLCHVDNSEKTPQDKVDFAVNNSELIGTKLLLLKENESVTLKL